MGWIRWETDTPQSDVVGWLAEQLGIELAQALGHYNAACCGFGAHRPDGMVSEVSDRLLEQWAMWRGEDGQFAAAFRERCMGEDGQLRGWWRQEKLLERAERDRNKRRPPKNPHKTPNGKVGEPPENPQETPVLRTDGRTYEKMGGDAADKLAEGPHRDAFLGFMRAARNPRALEAEVVAQAEGLPGHGASVGWLVIGQALHEMAAAGSPCTPQVLRAFARKVADRPKPQKPLYPPGVELRTDHLSRMIPQRPDPSSDYGWSPVPQEELDAWAASR